jgi:hypothetical protein
MAKEIYKSGNYIVTVDADDNSRLFPIGKTVYDEYNSVFRLTEGLIEDDQLVISYADSTNWVDDSAVAYTEATLRTFLRENTGFSPASGGSGAEWGGITGTLSTQTDLQSELDDKQDTLVSGTNIKTINGTSVLGSGDLAVGGGSGTSGYHMQLLPGGTYFGGIYQANTNHAGQNYSNQTFADRILYIPFIPSQDFSSTEMRIQCSGASAGDEVKLSIYSHDGLNAPQNLLYESAALDMSTTGYKTVTVNRNWTKGEVYWLGVHGKNGACRILGMGSNFADSLIIGLLNSGRFKMWGQTGQTFANGAPATANPNTFRYDVYTIEFK